MPLKRIFNEILFHAFASISRRCQSCLGLASSAPNSTSKPLFMLWYINFRNGCPICFLLISFKLLSLPRTKLGWHFQHKFCYEIIFHCGIYFGTCEEGAVIVRYRPTPGGFVCTSSNRVSQTLLPSQCVYEELNDSL